MKSAGRPILFLLALGLVILLGACGSVTSAKPGLNIVASVSGQTAGSMTFRIGVENTGIQNEKLVFSSSQYFDIEVGDLGGRPVWSYSYGASFADVLWCLDLAPGESDVREYVWGLRGNDQEPVRSGPYRARIFITNSPRDEALVKGIRLTI